MGGNPADNHRRVVLWGLASVLLLIVAAGYGLLATDLLAPSDVSRVVIAFILPNEDDIDLAQMVMVVDATDEDGSVSLEVIDPLAQTTISGTSYDTIADSYSFGGGGGIAAAVRKSSDESDLGWVLLADEAVIALVDGLGGLDVDIPQGVNVYVGEELYLFDEGPFRLSGLEFAAYLAGVNHAEYEGDRAKAHDLLVEALIGAVRADTDFDMSAMDVTTSLDEDAADSLRQATLTAVRDGSLAVR